MLKQSTINHIKNESAKTENSILPNYLTTFDYNLCS